MKFSETWGEYLMTNQHGGSRPVTREDDKRTKTKPGYTKLVLMRFEDENEEKEVMELMPDERVYLIVANKYTLDLDYF